MVKNHIQEEEEEESDLELSETGHLRRNYVPIAAQPIYECIPQQNEKQDENKRATTRFRGLRRQISISLDNVMKNGLFATRKQQQQQENSGITKKDDNNTRSVRARKSFRLKKENEKPIIEVQHNNASRLRMNQVKKQIAT